ncbi:hypothetical protein RN001_010887 [Aquatica leii]|uniref:Uncharacterized protein n=1 Tax=Aquatica leii TaxID=1421715 RepID=A0AAN7PAC6_9COLE|nr:hypothetical protein RN001_010887 [Aquatica leii]
MALYLKLNYDMCKSVQLTRLNKLCSNQPSTETKILKKEKSEIEIDHKPLEKSLTHKNIKQPLKKARLSNPFPAPIKTIPHEIISDLEKARIMQDSVQLPNGHNKSD